MNIVFWNIEGFSFNKFNDADVQNVIGEVMFPTPMGGNAVADIIIVIEVFARGTALGGVPAGAGAAGLEALAHAVMATDGNFVCIPPVSLADGGGRAEAIGVFYNTANLNFAGPMVWSNYGPVPGAEIGHTTANAAHPWDQLLPGPLAAFANAALPHPWNTMPGFGGVGALMPQIHFPNAANNAFLEFPLAGMRRPLRCQFTYNGGANMLDLWIVHLPPNGVTAGNALAQLATSPDIIAAPGANDIRVVCGDFNLNTGNPFFMGLYGPMTALGYTPQIGPAGTLAAGSNTHYKKYPKPANYLAGGLSLDNALTWPGAGMAVTDFDVIDMVAGTPALYFNSQLLNALGTYVGMPGNPVQVFRSWANFGHIGNRPRAGNMVGLRGASDHMPVYLEF